MNENYVTLTIGKQKNIALIAHDNKKAELIAWCETNKEILKNHFLCGTAALLVETSRSVQRSLREK